MAIKTYSKGVKTQLSKNFTSLEFDCQGKGCCSKTMVDEKLIIDGKGIVNIDNVRVTKGDMMYNKYFEGMKSSFEMEDTVKTIIKYCPIEFGKGGRIE